MKTLRLREIEQPVQGNPAGKCYKWDLNLGLFDSRCLAFATTL